MPPRTRPFASRTGHNHTGARPPRASRPAPKLITLAALGAALLVTACKSEAEQFEAADREVKAVDEACARADTAGARRLLEEASERSPVFQRAYEGSLADVPDRSRVNPCGLVLTDVKLRLENQRKR
jgi:hypothetical protein